MSALLTLAQSLGIDPGPLNQADLQEQTCRAALDEIKHWHDQMDKTCEEGCTPADAEKLKGFNAKLAYENFTLKNEIDSLAAQVERLKKIPYTKTRSEFMESWGVDGMPFDKKRLVIAAWDRAEWFFNQQVEQLKHERDEALTLVARYQSLLECAVRGEEIIVGDSIVIGIDAELADEIEDSFDESPKAAMAALKAQWQADILAEISLQVSASKPEATPIQIATAILTESKRIRQRAREAGDE
ncbi:hypothetical protein GJQ54_05100 [Oceanospirillaceae bacterium ASx5O]|nr:hypothetical protein GJQ54_05100 [Oceanospirillaceae bacterium ASx5O]